MVCRRWIHPPESLKGLVPFSPAVKAIERVVNTLSNLARIGHDEPG
jgi:hypothetical protein